LSSRDGGKRKEIEKKEKEGDRREKGKKKKTHMAPPLLWLL